MTLTKDTPLWLDLRKEYIDDNFDKLLTYLQRCSQRSENDSFYDITINLYRQRIEDLISQLATRPIYKDDDNSEDPTFNVRLLALYLLADDESNLAKAAYVALMGELRLLNPRLTDAILQNTIACLTHEKIQALGFGWNDLKQIGMELFVYNICQQASFVVPLRKPWVHTQLGTAMLAKDGLYLTYENATEAKKLLKSGASSIDTGSGVMLKTVASEKLKQSSEYSVADMMEYTTDFIKSMGKVTSSVVKKRLPAYSENDEAIIRIISIDYDGTIHVETTDMLYEKIFGVIKFRMQSLVYYYTDDMYRYFKPGDCFRAKVLSLSDRTFSIDESFVRFMVEDTESVKDEGDYLCQMIDEKPAYYVWLTDIGGVLYTKNSGEYSKGSFACLTYERSGTGREYGKVYGKLEGSADDEYITESDVRRDFMTRFAASTKAPASIVVKRDTEELSPLILKMLLRQLFVHQKSLLKPSERYRFLANAHVMAELVGDTLSASYIKFTSTYLRVLVQFVRNESISNLSLEPEKEYKDSDATLIRLSIVQLLKEYGRKDDSPILLDTISSFQESQPMLARLARLIQTANAMQGTLSDAAINVIRREIIKTLSLETEDEADLEADSSSYLGVESGTLEFKTSMVYPSGNNMQPSESAQNQNVLKGICAFLNSITGGTLYLGVNDQGYVCGITNDMKFLRMQTIDTYMRYVQDVAKKYLGIDSLPYITIEPLYENTVVAIHVKPHPYRVVELHGKAYLRVNAESRQMPEKVRQELIAQKMLTNRDKAAAISQLQHACAQQKCVKLHSYCSSNSGSVRDRFVEPYDVRPEDGLVICYDRDTATVKKVKVFAISRIGWVEILDNEPWKYPLSHTPIKVDSFHMSGDTPIHVSLQMDLFCRNLLVEEYPRTKGELTQDKQDENSWYYTGEVFNIEPIARFYLGLANRIKILESKELNKYVKSFVDENLKMV